MITVQEPNFKFEATSGATAFGGTFVFEPLEKGFGLTLGNSLRRAMLSALPGIAICGVRIEGVLHEFSYVEGVREDVLEILLNLKQVVLRREVDVQESFMLTLVKKGVGPVTAGDIRVPDKYKDIVKVVNKDLMLCEITSAEKELAMELDVKVGRGYDQNYKGTGNETLNTMFIDGHFTPVRKVSYNVSDARVGQDINYDKLAITVETNGAMEPDEVLKCAARILVSYYSFMHRIEVKKERDAMIDFQLVGKKEENVESNDDIPIKDLEFSVRSRNCLEMGNIKTLGQLAEVSIDELMQIKNFGKKSLTEIREKLAQYGLKLKDDREGV